MNGLKGRIERIQEQLNPTPPEMLCVVLRRVSPVQDPGAVQPPWYVVGKYATAAFMGGTPRERWREVKRLRKSGEYDIPLGCSRPAIAEGEETTEALPAGRGEGNGKAVSTPT